MWDTGHNLAKRPPSLKNFLRCGKQATDLATNPMYPERSSVDEGNRPQIWPRDPMYPYKSSIDVGNRPQIWQQTPCIHTRVPLMWETGHRFGNKPMYPERSS